MTAGEGGASGISYINKDASFYYGDNVPAIVQSSDAYSNANAPAISGIVITAVAFEIPKPSTEIGYFKGWVNQNDATDVLTREYGDDNMVATDDGQTVYAAECYDTSVMGKDHVSNAKAQAVTLSSGSHAIRFLALVDSEYTNYQSAGFIISSTCPTPTIEAGYQYSVQSKLYKKVKAVSATGATVWLDISSAELKNIFDCQFEDVGGILYANLVVTDESKTYYATPYVVNADGAYVYGAAKATSYAALQANDAAVASEQ